MMVAILADADPLRYVAEVKKPAVSVAPRHTQDQTVRLNLFCLNGVWEAHAAAACWSQVDRQRCRYERVWYVGRVAYKVEVSECVYVFGYGYMLFLRVFAERHGTE